MNVPIKQEQQISDRAVVPPPPVPAVKEPVPKAVKEDETPLVIEPDASRTEEKWLELILEQDRRAFGTTEANTDASAKHQARRTEHLIAGRGALWLCALGAGAAQDQVGPDEAGGDGIARRGKVETHAQLVEARV